MKKKNRSKFKIRYNCNCGCEIVKTDFVHFDRSKHYYIECPFCQKKMWVTEMIMKGKRYDEKQI